MSQSPIAGRAVYLPALLPCGLLLSAMPGIALAGLFILRGGIEWLGIGLLTFGAMGSVVFFVVLCYEFAGQDKLLTEHIAREQAVTARMQMPPPVQSVAPVAVVTTRHIEGYPSTTIRHYDNPPPKEFIEAIAQVAFGDGTRGRRVPERVTQEIAKAQPQWGAAWNLWLGILEKEGVLVKEFDAPNAPRKWADGISMMNAEAIFGYADAVYLPHLPTQSGVGENAP